jgi:hypothetical protein
MAPSLPFWLPAHQYTVDAWPTDSGVEEDAPGKPDGRGQVQGLLFTHLTFYVVKIICLPFYIIKVTYIALYMV